MRILLDEPVPRGVKQFLPDHDVSTVQERGWSSIESSGLLALASIEFDVFVTADQNIPRQQNLAVFDIAVVILAAASNRIEAYEPLAERLRDAVGNVTVGTVRCVTA